MGTEAEKLSGKLGVDTTDFKTGMAAANREIRILESGFRASAASLQDWASDASGLEMRIKSLTGQIDIQKSKVDALRAEHARLVEEHGEGSRAAQDVEIKLNKETETLGKMQTELSGTETKLEDLRSGNEEAGDSAKDMGDKVEKSGSKLESFKTILGGVGTVAKATVAGIVAVGVGAIAAVSMMAGLALKSAETADNLADMSAKTRVNTTTLQEWSFAAKILGTDIETMTGANAKLIRSMASAQDGTGTQAKAFETLGVKVTDANGKLRDSQVVFNEVLDRLGQIKNPTEQDALAMDIFGKSAQELNPIIAAGSAGLADLADQAHKVGAVMSEEDVAAGSALQDQLDGLKMGFDGVIAKVGMAFMPMISGLAGTAQGYLQELVGIVQGSGGDIGKMASGIGGLLGKVATDLAAQLPALAQMGVSILQSILKALIGALPQLVKAAVGIVTSLIGFLVQNLPAIMESGVQLLLTLVTAILSALPSLIGAAFQMIITLVTGIAAALPTLIPTIVQILITVVQVLIENLPLLVTAALQLITGLTMGLLDALPILIAAAPKLISSLVAAILQFQPMIVETALTLVIALAMALLANTPILTAAAWDLILQLGQVFVDWIKTLPAVGKSMLDGIWKGIQDNAGHFFDQVKTFFKQLLAEAMKAIGAHSPSTLFADMIGAQIPPGIWEGIEGGMPNLHDQLAAAMRGLAGSYDVAVNGQMAMGGASAGGPGSMGQAPLTVLVQGNQIASDIDITKLAYRVAREIVRRR